MLLLCKGSLFLLWVPTCTELNNLYIPSHFLHISYKLSISNSNVKLKRLIEEKDFAQIHTADK